MVNVFVKILPRLIAVEALVAAILLAFNRDWKHAFYWLSCASITFSATIL